VREIVLETAHGDSTVAFPRKTDADRLMASGEGEIIPLPLSRSIGFGKGPHRRHSRQAIASSDRTAEMGVAE
jgi:hypothetical protein